MNVNLPARNTRKRGRKHFLTSRLASAIDMARLSSGMAFHILVAAVEALGHRVEKFALNKSTIQRFRMENRITESKKISADFKDNVNTIKI